MQYTQFKKTNKNTKENLDKKIFKDLKTMEEKQLDFVVRSSRTGRPSWDWITPRVLAMQLEQIDMLKKYFLWKEKLDNQTDWDSDKIIETEKVCDYYRNIFGDKDKHIRNTARKFEDYLDEDFKKVKMLELDLDSLRRKEEIKDLLETLKMQKNNKPLFTNTSLERKRKPKNDINREEIKN